MELLIWAGAALTAIGLLCLVYCIAVAAQARRAGLEGTEMEARLRRLVAINLGALALSALGLMTLILGLFLG